MSQKPIFAADRVSRVVALRDKGLTYAEIGRIEGISTVSAWKIVTSQPGRYSDRTWSVLRSNAIIADAERGMSLPDIASNHGLKVSTVESRLRKLGHPVPKAPKTVEWYPEHAARRRQIVERCLSGLSMTEVAAEFGISRQRVLQILRKEGAASSVPEVRVLGPRLSGDALKLRNAAIVEFCKKGLRYKEIAATIGVTATVVATVAKRSGLPSRCPRKPERRADVVRRYLKGEAIASIADSHGLTDLQVRNIVAKARVPPRSKAPPERKATMLAMCRQGVAAKLIAEAFGTSTQNVYAVAKRAGIELVRAPRPGRPAKSGHPQYDREDLSHV